MVNLPLRQTITEIAHPTEPALYFAEEDQATPAGHFRLRIKGDTFYLEHATATDWSSSEVLLQGSSTLAGITSDAHKTSHQDTGSDEISVTGLSGLLADDQHVLDAEVTAVAIASTQKAATNGVASLNASSLVVQKPADRLSKANFEITLNKLLKGAGAGVNPTEIDVPAGMTEGERALLLATL